MELLAAPSAARRPKTGKTLNNNFEIMTQNTERSTVFSKIVGVRDISTDKKKLEKSIMKELEERRKYKEPDIEEKEMEKLEISNEGKMRDLRPTNHSESTGRIKKRRASLPAKQYRKCFRK